MVAPIIGGLGLSYSSEVVVLLSFLHCIALKKKVD